MAALICTTSADRRIGGNDSIHQGIDVITTMQDPTVLDLLRDWRRRASDCDSAAAAASGSTAPIRGGTGCVCLRVNRAARAPMWAAAYTLASLGWRRTGLVLGLAATSGLCPASPVHYVESVDGDLIGRGSLPILSLDTGDNTVSGTTGFEQGVGIDFDSFAFSIPIGKVLLAVEVELSDLQGNITGASWIANSGSIAAAGDWLGVLAASSPGSASLAGSYGAGTYNIGAAAISSDGRQTLNRAAYTFTLTVRDLDPTTVPEPGSLSLLGAAWLAFCTSSRGRRSAVVEKRPTRSRH